MSAVKLRLDEKDTTEFLDRVLDELADHIFTRSQEQIVQKEIIDEGTLLKSGNINRSHLNKEIIYAVPYADEIEFGRNPGTFPSVESLTGWVRRKLNVDDEKRAKHIAYKIAKDIYENGSLPRPFLRPAIEDAKTNLNQIINRVK